MSSPKESPAISDSGRYHQAQPSVSVLRVKDLHKFGRARAADGSVRERALISYEIEADLSSAFHWNVKQVFLILCAEYLSTSHVRNQVVVYDRIITSPEEAIIPLTDVFNEYPLMDTGEELKGTDVTFKLYYETMPYFGLLDVVQHGEYKFTLPVSV